MKKLILGAASLTAIAITAVIFYACNKDETLLSKNKIEESANVEKALPEAGDISKPDMPWEKVEIKFRFKRPAKDCESGFGLCLAKAVNENDVVDFMAQFDRKFSILVDKKGKYYSELTLDEQLIKDLSAEGSTDLNILPIEKDIFVEFEKDPGFNLILREKEYKYDKSIGKLGGYRIYFEKEVTKE